jgi:hypothetical protein
LFDDKLPSTIHESKRDEGTGENYVIEILEFALITSSHTMFRTPFEPGSFFQSLSGKASIKFYVGLRLGIDCKRLPRAAVRARQTRSFVYRVRVQHRSAAAACGC